MYLNGNLIGFISSSYKKNNVTRNNIYIGKSPWNGDSYLHAYVDEFRVYLLALSSS